MDHSDYTLLGSYSIRDAGPVCEALESVSIPFDLEIDDSAIKEMPTCQAILGGTFGSGAWANIYVPTGEIERCRAIVLDPPR